MMLIGERQIFIFMKAPSRLQYIIEYFWGRYKDTVLSSLALMKDLGECTGVDRRALLRPR
jgi:hypothetical protein